MTRFLKSFLFPDVNVWLALTYAGHIHHSSARDWLEEVKTESRVCFCRFTQISLLRLLTTQAIMGTDEVMTQFQAWQAFDRWLTDGRVIFLEEPPDLDGIFRALSRQHTPSPKTWADCYLAAFASVSGSRFVTFDRGFQGKLDDLLILRP
jgi:toxin-antitoxin system PIN domain toxin